MSYRRIAFIRACMATLLSVNILLPVASAAPSEGQTAGESLITNGSLERHIKDQPVNWNFFLHPRAAGVGQYLYPTKEKARDGDWSLKLNASTPPYRTDDQMSTHLVLFQTEVSPAVVALAGKKVILSGWVYVEPESAATPLRLRIRLYGPKDGKLRVYLGDLLKLSVAGQPGEWTQFKQEAELPQGVERLDIQGGWYSLKQPTIQYLDDLRLLAAEQ